MVDDLDPARGLDDERHPGAVQAPVLGVPPSRAVLDALLWMHATCAGCARDRRLGRPVAP